MLLTNYKYYSKGILLGIIIMTGLNFLRYNKPVWVGLFYLKDNILVITNSL